MLHRRGMEGGYMHRLMGPHQCNCHHMGEGNIEEELWVLGHSKE